MKKLTVSTREIGSVSVFDLEGNPTQETLQEVAWTIQKKIRRHRLQRVILNLQMMPALEPLGLRKLLAACIRPQKSLIFGASSSLVQILQDTYIPRNVRICTSEKEVAEDFGPFLMEKDHSMLPADEDETPGVASEVDRRRNKRMHVALPIDLKIYSPSGEAIASHAIATNISEGGLFAEYLDLEASHKIECMEPFDGLKVEVHIYPSVNFPEEYHLEGKLKRREVRKKQLGVAIEFQR